MDLVQRIYIDLVINYDSALSAPTPANENTDMENMESTNELGLRREDIISPQLILQLQAVRVRQQAAKVQEEEMKKRTRELAIAEDFEDC
ncbi:hypothetical protein BGZ50_003076 [Haplosporangium sp. Z 11]|nr:hypothetical protein BGZ50_003076 [Haplosporangium sp. Z 11]